MVVNAQSAKTSLLNLPAEAAKKAPIPMLAKAKGSVRSLKALTQCFIFNYNVPVMASSIGFTDEGKKATTFPFSSIKYLLKFQLGALPDSFSNHS